MAGRPKRRTRLARENAKKEESLSYSTSHGAYGRGVRAVAPARRAKPSDSDPDWLLKLRGVSPRFTSGPHRTYSKRKQKQEPQHRRLHRLAKGMDSGVRWAADDFVRTMALTVPCPVCAKEPTTPLDPTWWARKQIGTPRSEVEDTWLDGPCVREGGGISLGGDPHRERVEAVRREIEAAGGAQAYLQRFTGKPSTRGNPERAQVGELWRLAAKGRGQDTLALITRRGHVVYRAVLVTQGTRLAAEDDLLVPASASPTPRSLSLHLWRDVPVSPEDLHAYAGTLPEQYVEPLLRLLQDRRTGGFRAVESTTPGHWEISLIGGAGEPAAYVTGSPLLPDDPRHAVRQRVWEATTWVEESALDAIL